VTPSYLRLQSSKQTTNRKIFRNQHVLSSLWFAGHDWGQKRDSCHPRERSVRSSSGAWCLVPTAWLQNQNSLQVSRPVTRCSRGVASSPRRIERQYSVVSDQVSAFFLCSLRGSCLVTHCSRGSASRPCIRTRAAFGFTRPFGEGRAFSSGRGRATNTAFSHPFVGRVSRPVHNPFHSHESRKRPHNRKSSKESHQFPVISFQCFFFTRYRAPAL
jgi:hypothetical protein